MVESALVVGVLGLGSLGEGLAAALLASGVEVVGVDPDPVALDRARLRLGDRALSLGAEVTDLKRAHVVVEAVPEDAATKEAVLRSVVDLCPPETVLVTTTASVPVPWLAIAAGCSTRLLGLRFPLPPPLGRTVEVVPTAMTSPEAFDAVRSLVKRLDREVVNTGRRAADAATDLVYAHLNRCAALLDEGYATRDDIDAAMRLGCGLPLGPLRVLDEIGVGSVRSALLRRHAATGDDAFRPAPVLDRMVADGALGRVARRGFHDYDEVGEVIEPAAGTGTAEPPGRPVARVGVIGSGTMAQGIAEVAAIAGIPTVLLARSAEKAAAAITAIDASLARGVRRGRIPAATRTTALALITEAHDYTALSDCDFVVEAVAEDPEVKRAVFTALDAVAKPGAVLATSTSSLAVADCAAATGRPADVVGTHFFNPAPVMGLVEVVRAEGTADDAAATARALARRLGKTPVDCADRAGFIVNHLLFPYLNDAIRLLGTSELGIEEVDAAVEAGYGHPMGPFALLDTIGLDVSLQILRKLAESGRDGAAPPEPALERLVAEGRLGRKSGSGFRQVGNRSSAVTR
ncbi:3-hydroxybutyryl-CoA dehydrogenase [Actinokineospora spheciospongiae]|uniref:3-hydroxybutyryl-CoA dehydrogenase n=1 Tax=Actinokineospora spheciospongiae TaxID=909613 RepID=W7J4T3_9PSEU|nr:3-hydroxyacyl-CoA dehydrogenase family protein [Actinokineospora spheciospongiae]EWC64006.1 3-hydroxybutyryl-CoA dehydrogenase [Actinokineospora spheciospongiae]